MLSFPESSFTDCPIFRSDSALFLFYTALFFLVLVTYFHRMYFPMNEKTRKHMLPGITLDPILLSGIFGIKHVISTHLYVYQS